MNENVTFGIMSLPPTLAESVLSTPLHILPNKHGSMLQKLHMAVAAETLLPYLASTSPKHEPIVAKKGVA